MLGIHNMDNDCLICAVRYERLLRVRELINKYRANVNTCTNYGYTPLLLAAKKGFVDIAEYLLNHGACVDSATLKKGYTPLHFAAKQGHEDTVKLLLSRGADINAVTNDNLTPLHVAAERGRKSVVKLLLQSGAKVDIQDKDGKTILQVAVEKGNFTVVQDILKYCPDVNNKSNRSSLQIALCGLGEEYKKIVQALLTYGFIVKPSDANDSKLLLAAVENGHLKIVADLLKYDADVNVSDEYGRTALYLIACKRVYFDFGVTNTVKVEIAKLLLSKGADVNYRIVDGETALHVATRSGYTEVVKTLLEYNLNKGADVNAESLFGNTPLHISVDRGDKEICTMLLNKGANVDAKQRNGMTALHISVAKGNVEICTMLLNRGADVDAREDDGMTALHISVIRGYKEMCTILLNKGANVNAKGWHGMTALHLAFQRNNKEICTMLLDKRADIHAKEEDGMTALHFAAETGNADICTMLLNKEADVNAREKDGNTALHIASEEGHVKVVETLLLYGSDINITNRNNETSLDCAHGSATEILEQHIVKMTAANLYVSANNLLLMSGGVKTIAFQCKCEKEIKNMKAEKIGNSNISFYDTLAKSINSLARCMRNEEILQILQANEYERKFPIYASMMKSHFRKGIERKELLEQGHNIFHLLFRNFPELPHECVENILNYLSNKYLINSPDAYKSF